MVEIIFIVASLFSLGTLGSGSIAVPPLTTTTTVLNGRVMDRSERPVSGAIIGLHADVGRFRHEALVGPMLATTRSRPDGRFELPLPLPLAREQVLVLLARAPGFALRVVEIPMAADGGGESLEIRICEGLSLSGRVVDSFGQPVKAAQVTVLDAGLRAEDWRDQVEARVETDDRGLFFSAELSPGRKTVVVEAEGHVTMADHMVDLQRGRARAPVRIPLGSPGAEIRGRIVVVDTGEGIEGARVQVQSHLRLPWSAPRPFSFAVTTDEQGSFAVTGLWPGVRSHFVVRLPPGYELTSSSREVTAPATAIRLTASRTPQVIGRVIEADSGAPIRDFEIIEARSAEWAMDIPGQVHSFSDPEGRFSFHRTVAAAKTAMPFHLVARAADHALVGSDDIEDRDAQENEEIVIPLSRGVTVSGRIVDGNGAGLASARVELHPFVMNVWGCIGFPEVIDNSDRIIFASEQSHECDEQGYFIFEHATPSLSNLVIRHPDHAPRRIAVTQSSSTGVCELGQVALDPGTSVRGRVLGERDKPLAHVDVILLPRRQGWLGSIRVETDAEGLFGFEHLNPGDYELWSPYHGGRPHVLARADPRRRVVQVRAGPILELGDWRP